MRFVASLRWISRRDHGSLTVDVFLYAMRISRCPCLESLVKRLIGLSTLILLAACDGPTAVEFPTPQGLGVAPPLLLSVVADARTELLGSTTFERRRGAPALESIDFGVTDPSSFEDVLLEAEVRPGPAGKGGTPVEVLLNGEVVLDEVVRTTTRFELPVSVSSDNVLQVRLAGTPGSTAVIRITANRIIPRWVRLSAENEGPHNTPVTGRVVSTYAPELDAVFVVEYSGDFGPGQLWRFDLATRAWTFVPTTGWPVGKVRQYHYDPDTNEILVAWDGLGTVWSVSATGGAWSVKQPDALRQTHFTGSFFYDRANNQFTHMFGFGFGSTRRELHTLGATGWVLEPWAPGPVPRARVSWCYHTTDQDGRFMYLSGGHNEFGDIWDDLWTFDLVTRSWTEVISEAAAADDRQCAGMAHVDGDLGLYRFGGALGFVTYLDELQRLEAQADGSVAWEPVAVEGDRPIPRVASLMIFDRRRGELVLFGGFSDAKGQYLSDVWSLKVR